MAINVSYTAQDLIKIVKSTYDKRIIIGAICHQNANKDVLDEAIERIDAMKFNTNSEHIQVMQEVIKSTKVTSDLLIKVINKTASANVMISAINSSIATEKVLNEAIERIDAIEYSHNSEHIQVMQEVIKSTKVTLDLLIKVINKTASANVMISAINSSIATEKVLNEAIDSIDARRYNTSLEHIKVMQEVIKSNIVTPALLTYVIKKTGSYSVIIEAVESPMADDSVYDAALGEASHYHSSGQKGIMDAVAKAKATPKPKIIPLNQPQITNSPNVPTQCTSTINNNNSNNNSSNNSNNNVDVQQQTIIENLKFIVETEDNVTSRLRRNVEDGMSSMLWGLSGIGKTARVEEVDPNYTMLKLKNDMLPEEVTGGKEPNGEPGAVYPPYWYVKLCKKCEEEPDKMHILFIDELTNVKNNVKSLVWDIIEDRRVNGNEDWQLPENCAIVAAGNRPEESTAVITDYNGGVLPEPLHDRFDFHIEIPLDMNEWQKWALETNPKTGNLNIHPVVLSFCVANAQRVMFTSLNRDDITQPRLSPRRWEKLSKAIFMAEKRGGKACHVSNQRITECIGTDVASAFIAYYEKQPINMEKVEAGLYKPEDFQNIDDKLYALSSLIAEYKGSEMAVIDFIETCLGDDYVSIYNVMKKQQIEITNPIEKEEKEEKQTVKK